MLDTIKKMAAEFLGITLKEVRETREALHAEVATEEGRYAARTQLTHPEGSTTPLNDAADRAQNAFATIRDKMEAELPKVMRLLLAYDVAQQRRDEAAAARDRHWDAEMTRRATGVHPKVDEYFRRLFKHGVTPHSLAQHRDEDVAIVADLHRWKAEDPKYLNSNNPWQQIYGIYATRVIAVPGGGRTVKRSVVGTPVRTKRYAADKWYMFNEIAAHFDSKSAAIPQSQPVEPPAAVSAVAAEVSPATDEAIASTPPVAAATMTGAQGVAADDNTEPARESQEVVRAVDEGNAGLSPERARDMAEAIYAQETYRLSIYWPKDLAPNSYDPDTLIPALERWVASDDNWIGAGDFLKAARRGMAREFIEEKRRAGIERLTGQLLAGEDEAVMAAKRLRLMS